MSLHRDFRRCWSYVGRDSWGPTTLNLQKYGCWWKGIVIHELLVGDNIQNSVFATVSVYVLLGFVTSIGVSKSALTMS